jgi:hypothetical protein
MAKRKARSRGKRTSARPLRTRTASRRARPARRARRSPRKAVKTAAKKPSKRATLRRKAAKPARRKAVARAVKPARRAVRPKARAAKSSRPTPAALQRDRRRLADAEGPVGAPSQLGYTHRASSAESGQNKYDQKRREHTEGGPVLTSGDVDADWNDAYSSGEETPGGDMPTPDQDVVEEIGRALGVQYDDAEELKGSDKILERDRNRWEYDPASSEDYGDRNRKQQEDEDEEG